LHGKGRKERIVPLWAKTGRVLRSWFRELEGEATELAFPSVRGAPLSSDGLNYLLQQAVKHAAGSSCRPTHILAAFDSGDHLHPQDDGYKAMADSIDLKMLTTRP
jgi:site-specific recombinase XerD